MGKAVEPALRVGPLKTVDWSCVGYQVNRASPNLLDFLQEDIAARVVEAAAIFCEEDLEGAQDLIMEEGILRTTTRGKHPWKHRGFVDLAIKKKGVWNLYDWKFSSSKAFTIEAEERLRWDPAWCFYLNLWSKTHGPVSDIFTYRQVLLKPEKGSGVKSLELQRTAAHLTLNRQTFLAAEQIVEALEKIVPWPLNIPNACHAFGSPCPHKSRCESLEFESFPIRRTLSPSAVKTLKLCPERARHYLREREIVDRDEFSSGGSSNDYAESGTAFHAGITEVYRQLWEKRRK